MNRYAADDSAGTMTTGHKQHQYQQQQHFQHRADGGSGDSRRWPATIRLPRRANKKLPAAAVTADFRKFPDSAQEVGSPDRNLLPPPPPSLCYREPFRRPMETCEAVEWDAICKQFAR